MQALIGQQPVEQLPNHLDQTGSGLGLAIVLEAARACDGTVGLTAPQDGERVVTIRIPLAPD